MTIDRDTVKRAASLARIKVNDEQADSLTGELNTILNWIDQLNEVDTDGVEPVFSVTDMNAAWRKDEVTTGQITDEVLGNAPKAHNGHFVVPKVIE